MRKISKATLQVGWKKDLRLVLFPAAAAFLGAIAWGYGDLAGLAAGIFVLWSMAENRLEAYTIALAYYLGGSWVIPDASRAFFGHDWSFLAGLAMWFAAAAINAAPWAWLRPSMGQTVKVAIRQNVLRLGVLAILLSIPPLAFVGWLNPFLGAAWFFPGAGFWAFLGGFGIIVAIVTVLPRSRNVVVASALIALTFGCAAYLGQRELPPAPSDWVGIETRLGAFPITAMERFDSHVFIATESDRQIRHGKRVIVFPETVLGNWEDKITGAFLAGALKKQLADTGATVIAGALFQSAAPGESINGVIVIDGEKAVRLDSRQPIPVSMWRPWSEETVRSNWASTGVHTIANRKVLLSFCYEDFVPLLHLIGFALDKPELIVSVANGWWVKNTNEPAIQYRHIATIARVFDTPLVRALNR